MKIEFLTQIVSQQQMQDSTGGDKVKIENLVK